MQSNIGSGVVGGLIGGLIFGTMMQMMTASTPDGQEMPMMMMVAQVINSESLAVGWIYHLVNSAIIGGIFGWVLGGLILMPVLLGMNVFAPLTMEGMRPVALGSFIGHLVFGLILGASYVALHKKGGGRVSYRERRPV